MAVHRNREPYSFSLECRIPWSHCLFLVLSLPRQTKGEIKQDLATDHCHKQQNSVACSSHCTLAARAAQHSLAQTTAGLRHCSGALIATCSNCHHHCMTCPEPNLKRLFPLPICNVLKIGYLHVLYISRDPAPNSGIGSLLCQPNWNLGPRNWEHLFAACQRSFYHLKQRTSTAQHVSSPASPAAGSVQMKDSLNDRDGHSSGFLQICQKTFSSITAVI